MKQPLKKRLMLAGGAAGAAMLLAGAFLAGRMYPMERASAMAGEEDFTLIDNVSPWQHSTQAPAPLGTDPFASLQEMQKEMDELFNRTFAQIGGSAFPDFPGFRNVPDMDLRDDGEQYLIRLDMPGVETGSINVEVEGDRVTISGTRTQGAEQEEGQVLRRERHTGSFTRSTILPEAVDPGAVETEYENGVLTVRIPKAS